MVGSYYIPGPTFPTIDPMTSCDDGYGDWRLVGTNPTIDQVENNQRRCHGYKQPKPVPKPPVLDKGDMQDIIASADLMKITNPGDIQKCIDKSLVSIHNINNNCTNWDGSAITLDDLASGCERGYLYAACTTINAPIPYEKPVNVLFNNDGNDDWRNMTQVVGSNYIQPAWFMGTRPPLIHPLYSSSNGDCINNGIHFDRGHLTCEQGADIKTNKPNYIKKWENDLEYYYTRNTCAHMVNYVKKNNIMCDIPILTIKRRAHEIGYSNPEEAWIDICQLKRRFEATCYDPENKTTYSLSHPVNTTLYNAIKGDWNGIVR